MKRYKSIFKESKEDVIKRALNFADSGSFPVNRKVFRFMMYLNDEQFDIEEIKQLACEFYKIHRSKVEGIFKEVERLEKI
jgi:hypothetical protein